MKANYHTHTARCKHASGSEREYVKHAIDHGFSILGFSDHVPQPYPDNFTSGIRMSMDELPEYVDTLIKLRDEYRDRIEILIGFEVEYTHKYFDKLINILSDYPIDYIILGQHYVPDEIDGFYVGAATSDESKLKAYADFTIEAMKTGLFTYPAHPDLINYTGDHLTYLKHMERIVATAIDLNLPLEINMYGFLDKRNYPRNLFFKMASDMGASFIIGCDAHRPDIVLQPNELAGFAEFLKRNNITYGDNTVQLRSIHA